MDLQLGIINVQETKPVAQRKRRTYFAIQTAKHKKRRYEPRYIEVAPNTYIKV